MVTRNESRPCFFPDSIERIPLCAADKSIPAVESVAGDERAAMELERLSRLVESQVSWDWRTPGHVTQCSPLIGPGRPGAGPGHGGAARHGRLQTGAGVPPARTLHRVPDRQVSSDWWRSWILSCDWSRLILSHLGFLSLPALRAAVDSPVPRLVVLDNDSERFCADLAALDAVSSRTQDTLLLYYVAAGQTRAHDIVSNARSGGAELSTAALYTEMLGALGWPVSCAGHAGWAGGQSAAAASGGQLVEAGPGRFNGAAQLLYWADVTGELAILVPTATAASSSLDTAADRPSSAQGAAFLMQGAEGGGGVDPGAGYEGGARLERAPTSLSLELGGAGAGRKVGRGQGGGGAGEQRVVVAWLESIEDAETFPLGDLVTSINNVCLVIFIHPLANGLLRIKLAGQIGK